MTSFVCVPQIQNDFKSYPHFEQKKGVFQFSEISLIETAPHLDVAAEEGFEPPQNESESLVLPLHYSAMSTTKLL